MTLIPGSVLLDPPAAIAAAICLAARVLDPTRHETARHRGTCAFCEWPLEDLRSNLDAFNRWAAYDQRSGRYGRHEMRVWQDVPARRQAELIAEAQGIPPAPVFSETISHQRRPGLGLDAKEDIVFPREERPAWDV